MFPAERPRALAAAMLAGVLLAGMLPAVALADGPVANDDGLSAIEDGGPTSLDVLANDSSGDTLTITDANAPAPQHGATTTDGLTITYTPDPDFNGVDTFGYTITDAEFATASATVTVTVTSVNDAPSGANATVVTNEDTAYLFTAADFGLTDSHDSPPNGLESVVVATLPSVGALTLDGSAVQAGDEIAAADISSGKLQFKPALNGNGTGYATFTFRVRDDGGTSNGGIDLSSSPTRSRSM